MRLALALLVLGYGTKVGLAPMHSWLPDAHSQAPAPVSALMSGVLLTVAFYVLLRFKAVADGALGVGFSRMLFVTAGLLSLAVAASLLLSQRDYKRMLAYHSVEHMVSSPWARLPEPHSPSPRYCCTCSATGSRRPFCFSPPARSSSSRARPRSTR